MAIANGFIVEIYPQGTNGGPAGPTVSQYCADLNAVAAYLVAAFVPGATYTPPAS
jgi:hypothetical protein